MVDGWLVTAALGVGLVIGAVITGIIVLSAITGRRVADVTTAKVPQGIEAVLDVLPAPAIVIDPSNRVLRATPSAHDAGLLGPTPHPEILEIADEVREHGEPVSDREVTIEGGGGRRDAGRHLRVSAALVGARFVLIVADDQTDAVRLEAVRRDFVANVSHELKTPIGAVTLLAEAIESAADDPERVRKFSKRLATEGQRLTDLTQDIIELSHMQGGGPIVEAERIKVDTIIAAAIDQNRVAAEARGITIVAGSARGFKVLGHRDSLVTAVHNLVANAVQYSPDRGRVGVGVTERDGRIEIAVTDQGQGIPPEEQERIFERFFRSDPARSRVTGGTGLGLSIVKHAVANHGGDVTVWSQPGRGSTFTIRIPSAESLTAAEESLMTAPVPELAEGTKVAEGAKGKKAAKEPAKGTKS